MVLAPEKGSSLSRIHLGAADSTGKMEGNVAPPGVEPATVEPSEAAYASQIASGPSVLQAAEPSMQVSLTSSGGATISRSRGGRPSLQLEQYVRFKITNGNGGNSCSRSKGQMKFLCCPAERWRAFHSTRVYEHLRDCKAFFRRDPAGLESIVRAKEGVFSW